MLSKMLGCYSELITELKTHGIKMHRADSLQAFLRIMSQSNKDVIGYYNEAKSKLRINEQLFLRYLLHSGLRVSECVASFNLVVELSNQNRLNEYYDPTIKALIHMRYQKLFIRKTKNAYFTFISDDMLKDITNSSKVSYAGIRKRLESSKMTLRLKEFRKQQNTKLLNSGLSEIEVNLVSGRVNGILLKNYFSPKLPELGAKVLKALETIETQ